jgi:S-adenosylmethionine-diacylgycerolhomoserine-N-methlytransferase
MPATTAAPTADTAAGSAAGTASAAHDPGAAMDRIYRLQRHIYDATRKFYLFGRDGLIERLAIVPGEIVLEVGCGTARNLILMARRYPAARFYGIDASRAMLDTAAAHVQRAGLAGRITLAHGYAECLDPAALTALGSADDRFSRIVFSYSLSMIPPWRAAIDAALRAIKPGGEIHIVDFWDQAGWPRWFQSLLQSWIALFGVHHRPELLGYLEELERSGQARITIESIGRRYAFRAVVRPMV